MCSAAFEDAPEEVDITVFECNGPDAEAITSAAAELVSKVSTCSVLILLAGRSKHIECEIMQWRSPCTMGRASSVLQC